MEKPPQFRFVRRFAELRISDVPLVGGKNASLGEMYSTLAAAGVKVPDGFATTAEAFRHFLAENDLIDRIKGILSTLQVTDLDELQRCGATIRDWIMNAEMPDDLIDEIASAYQDLAAEYDSDLDVAVRSSATAEDLPDASFAGQQETLLHIRGIRDLLSACKQVYASLYTDRAIAYRVHKGFDHMDVALSLGIQHMVRSDTGAAGVIFTLDTETGFRDVVLITGAYGLGENVVQGKVNPDEFCVFKPTLRAGRRSIIKKQLGDKALRLAYDNSDDAAKSVHNTVVSKPDRERFVINDDEVLALARYALAIEDHYSKQAGHPVAMDIEWAKDGGTDELFILQARPETVHTTNTSPMLQSYRLQRAGTVLARGKSIGNKIGSGQARIIVNAAQMAELQPGEVLVTDITDPDWEPIMKKAAAIVANRGGRTCHAAIVARELGIPAIVGTGTGTKDIASGEEVTVVCAGPEAGSVYRGILPYNVTQHHSEHQRVLETKLMMNIGNPDQAFEFSMLPNDGVGLARLEFIIANHIRLHPSAVLDYEHLDVDLRQEIDEVTLGYPDAREFYVAKLTEGIATIAAAFYPKPVIVRLSDFKSNEYSRLIGGTSYEPKEENPMLGFRGASRYPSKAFRGAFSLECEAIKRARETIGLDNIIVMIPFVRTVAEEIEVMELLKEYGLSRGENGLKIYLMCEIPSNALLANRFLENCDGYSIGSNDLTQLTLGVDRDSSLLSGIDERDEAVMDLMDMAITACRAQSKYIGICGQAPSDYPEITQWLVERGIGSISLNPDSLLAMAEVVAKAELSIKPQLQHTAP